MPRYSPHEPPDGFLVSPSSKGFLVLQPQKGASDQPTWEQVDGPFAERWYAVKKANDAWRRAGIWEEITTALGSLLYAHQMSPVEYENVRQAVQKAYVDKDETALLRYLAQYLPDSPRLNEAQ
jgi:hypothetical protein